MFLFLKNIKIQYINYPLKNEPSIYNFSPQDGSSPAPSEPRPPIQDDTDYSALENASHDELIATLKKQRQTALRYKGRFSEVSNWFEVSSNHSFVTNFPMRELLNCLHYWVGSSC